MKRRSFAFLLAAALLFPAAPAARAADLPISAPAALLMEKATGTVLYAKDEHARFEPASVTKVMTLLLVMEAIDSGRLSYDDTVTGSAHASSMGGSQIWLREGEQMSVRDLLKAVCVVSGNDASVALGEHLAGSEAAFVARMNERAAQLGMNDTTFVNCTGLPAEGHLTSAYDIALMSRELILNHPGIRQFTTIWMDTLRGGESELVNTNKLIRFYDGATGLKTGSTSTAGYCLSATAEREGMELIAVVLDGKTSDERFTDAKTLLNHGFASYALHTVKPDAAIPPVPVTLGAQAYVQGVVEGEQTLLLAREDVSALSQNMTLCEKVDAPVARGDALGELTVFSGETVLARIPIVAGEDVAKLTWGELFVRFFRTALGTLS
ncbi:MAG: D-alanyl-D-alanine carboxypeptidase [Oscillospiraceae bacterium]|nr:D-alanyl-D-alanine carboxypeptidase [Oscillospiraceae bacterium]